LARIAVIPARGGSKRIPRKNVRPFNGRPMIAWSISAALESGCFDRVIVSTDDEEISAVAVAHGAQVPFVRPEELADDHATTGDVMAHAAAWLTPCNPSAICCLYATAPFVSPDDLRRAMEMLDGHDYVVPVTSFSFPIQRAVRLGEDGAVSMLHPEHRQSRSQDLEAAFHDAGQFYWGSTQAWLQRRPIFSPSSRAFVIPRWRVQDIDDEEDWKRAEMMFSVIRLAAN
jgi:pseudaminic acid cytidylyltransferase